MSSFSSITKRSSSSSTEHETSKTTTKTTPKSPNTDHILLKCVAGGIGCGISGFATNPMDVIKIKNQQYGGAQFGTLTGTARHLWQLEGARGFFKGASASVLREMTYSSLRMGLYEPIKSILVKATAGTSANKDTAANSMLVKWSSAFLSGAIGAALFNPVDLVKVRFQSQLPGHPKPYPSLVAAFTTIYRHEHGFHGLYNGTLPTVVRAACLTSAQLGSYDILKNNILVQRLGLDHEAVSTHLVAALLASLVTTTAANPADVVKTRVMNDASLQLSKNKTWYHCQQILANEGPSAFLKGWTASYCRIGPHTVMSFVLIEKVRQLLGMATY